MNGVVLCLSWFSRKHYLEESWNKCNAIIYNRGIYMFILYLHNFGDVGLANS